MVSEVALEFHFFWSGLEVHQEGNEEEDNSQYWQGNGECFIFVLHKFFLPFFSFFSRFFYFSL